MSQKITASIIGITGYTGLELLRILKAHPDVEIKHLISASTKEGDLTEIYPHLLGSGSYPLSSASYLEVAQESDVVFLALPHLVSQDIVPDMVGKTKIIDLSGDFRLKNLADFQQYYGAEHKYAKGLEKFVYGLSELNREQIAGASCIANPGCFATAISLALLPLGGAYKKAEVMAVTGSSGSGKTPADGTHHPVRAHNMKSYKIGAHQHLPEIAQTLGVEMNKITMVPTSGPFVRGIFATIFVSGFSSEVDTAVYMFEKYYMGRPFVRIKPVVALSDVIGSNFCDISVTKVGDTLVIQSVIDNLVKGAAGQAVQNMNLMMGLDVSRGLGSLLPLYP
ncbi:MAG: N-acetyl-gamma-glutamyl-phosphate reductase [Patescibacteria group bacterium]